MEDKKANNKSVILPNKVKYIKKMVVDKLFPNKDINLSMLRQE